MAKARRKPRPTTLDPVVHDRDRQPARRHRARDDQYAVARGALGGDFQRPRFLLLHPHRRQSAARLGRRACRCISSAPTCRARTCAAITRATSARAMPISTTILTAATPIRPTTPSWCRCSSAASTCSPPSPNATWRTSATAFRRATSPRRSTSTRKARWCSRACASSATTSNEPDIIRMCRARIRVPEQWYGDALAALGSARVAERRLKELCGKYGSEDDQGLHHATGSTIRSGAPSSQSASCRRRASSIPAGRDPLEGILPDGLTLKVTSTSIPSEAMIDVDLRDNPPCVDCGLNTSRAAATSAVVGAIFNSLDKDIPRNAGSFRRLRFKYAENSVVASPVFPHSCSTATTNVSERLVNITQSAFAQLGDGHGLAEGGTGLGAGMAVLSGKDHRRNDAPLRQPHDAVDQWRAGEPDRRRLGELRYPGDRRADVSRQRRDRRAQAPVPRGDVGCRGGLRPAPAAFAARRRRR